MRKVLIYSGLLVLGLIGSQLLPALLPGYGQAGREHVVAWLNRLLTMVCLSFIMIHVGYEFEIDKRNIRQYGWDYVVAATAAAFPWLFCCLYFVFVMAPASSWGSWPLWQESLLASRFASPTSAGVLFSMLAAAGLSATWVFRKARVLAIFDDLDTILLMVPLKMMMVGVRWQLAAIVLVIVVLLGLAWRYLHVWRIPISWPWVLSYAAAIAAVSEFIYKTSKLIDDTVPVHLEVLLPAFVLGCMMARPAGADPHVDDAREGHEEGPETPAEQRASTVISAVFMLAVGLSMPAVLAPAGDAGPPPDPGAPAGIVAAPDAFPGWGVIALHVLAVTAISNLGKMFPVFCYRREAHWRERLAVAVGMFPRGEVGAGVLVVSVSYGLGGPVLTVALLSLALNLLLTGAFIAIVKKLLAGAPVRP